MTRKEDTWITGEGLLGWQEKEMLKATWKRHYKVTLDSGVKHSAALTCVSPKNSLHNARDLFSDKINAFLILIAYILALNNDNEY